jgi:hypothetical protein
VTIFATTLCHFLDLWLGSRFKELELTEQVRVVRSPSANFARRAADEVGGFRLRVYSNVVSSFSDGHRPTIGTAHLSMLALLRLRSVTSSLDLRLGSYSVLELTVVRLPSADFAWCAVDEVGVFRVRYMAMASHLSTTGIIPRSVPHFVLPESVALPRLRLGTRPALGLR